MKKYKPSRIIKEKSMNIFSGSRILLAFGGATILALLLPIYIYPTLVQVYQRGYAAGSNSVLVTNQPAGTVQTQLSTNNVWAGSIDQQAGAQASMNALHAPLVRIHMGDDGTTPAALPEIKYNNWDFSSLDTLVNNVTKSGQKALMNVKFAPDWMWSCYPNSIGINNTQGTGTVKDLTFQTFAQYMARLVSYYNKGSMVTETGQVIVNPAGTANRATYWELWNEPDLNVETPCAPSNGVGITSAQYVTMWNAATVAMLAVDPTIQFVGPATAGAQFGSSQSTGNQYIDDLMAGASVKPTALSFHGYGYWDNTVSDKWIFDGDNSDPASNCCGGITDLINGTKAIHASYPTTPIWLTEVNVNADWGDDTHKRPWNEFAAAWWGSAFQQLAPLGVGIIHEYDVIDSPQFGLLSDQTGNPYMNYYVTQLLNQAFPQGSTILSSTSYQAGILSLAAQKPDGTISVLVVNRQVGTGASNCGTGGLPASVGIVFQGITPTSITKQQLDRTNINCSTNMPIAPATQTLDSTQPITLIYPGYGITILTITTNGSMQATPTVPAGSTPTPTSTILPPTPTPTPKPTATPTPKPTATPVPTSNPGSGSSLIIYDNAVSTNFKDNTFSYSSKNPCDTSTYVSSPCSYAATFQAYGSYEFISRIGSLTPSSYKSLDYNINTGGQSISTFGITISTLTGGWINEIFLSSANVTQNFGNGWVHISVPFSQLNPNNKLFGQLDLENHFNRSISQIHIDDVQLVGY